MKKLFLPLLVLMAFALSGCDSSAASAENLSLYNGISVKEDLPDGYPTDGVDDEYAAAAYIIEELGDSCEFDDSSEENEQEDSSELYDTQVDCFDLFSIDTDAMSVEERLSLLEEIFPDGSYWNHYGYNTEDYPADEICTITTDTPCDHSNEGYLYCNTYKGDTAALFDYGEEDMQCLGFASLISDFLFGKCAPVNIFYDFDELQVGDHIRLIAYEHSMIVTGVYDGYVTVAECNENYEDCRISWGREFTFDDYLYYSGSLMFISRRSEGDF